MASRGWRKIGGKMNNAASALKKWGRVTATKYFGAKSTNLAAHAMSRLPGF